MDDQRALLEQFRENLTMMIAYSEQDLVLRTRLLATLKSTAPQLDAVIEGPSTASIRDVAVAAVMEFVSTWKTDAADPLGSARMAALLAKIESARMAVQ